MPPPIWLMRQAGRYLPEYRKLREAAGSFLTLCYTPKIASEVTLQPLRRFPLDAAILFSDILVVPQALGQPLDFREGEGPVLKAIQSVAEIEALSGDDLRTTLAPVYDTISRVKSELPDEAALIGFAGAPWTIATYMVEGGSSRDFARVTGWATRAPEEFAQLIEILVAAISDHLVAQVEAGVEVVQIFDSWCSAAPEPLFESLCLEPMREIANRLKQAHPEVPIIAFPRGAGERFQDYTAIPEIDALSIDASVSLEWARDTLQPHVAVQGNLDPLLLRDGGEAMRTGATRILEILSGGPFVFNLGHGVVPETPPENVAALCELVHEWGG
jgi:uroporphyrinogen decarboxylase